MSNKERVEIPGDPLAEDLANKHIEATRKLKDTLTKSEITPFGGGTEILATFLDHSMDLLSEICSLSALCAFFRDYLEEQIGEEAATKMVLEHASGMAEEGTERMESIVSALQMAALMDLERNLKHGPFGNH